MKSVLRHLVSIAHIPAAVSEDWPRPPPLHPRPITLLLTLTEHHLQPLYYRLSQSFTFTSHVPDTYLQQCGGACEGGARARVVKMPGLSEEVRGGAIQVLCLRAAFSPGFINKMFVRPVPCTATTCACTPSSSSLGHSSYCAFL